MLINFFKTLYLNNQSKIIKKNIALNIDTSSILLPGTSLRFDVGMEKRKYVEIGRKCILSCSFIFESQSGMIRIGDNVQIGGAKLISRSSIIIGNDITMAWGIIIYDHDSHSIHWEHRKNDNVKRYDDYAKHNNGVLNKEWTNVISKPIVIEDKVWIGFDVTILKGVHIGEGAVIGAKSVVTKDIPAWSVVAGNPARIIKTLK